MNYDYEKLKDDISGLLIAMPNFTPSEIAEVEQFLAVDEYGLAFETLCGIAREENKPVPAQQYYVPNDPSSMSGVSN